MQRRPPPTHPHPPTTLAQVDIVTLDLSFISVLKVLPAVVGALRPEGGQLVVLIKPQFEAGRGAVSAGGVVRDPKVHLAWAGVGGEERGAAAVACTGRCAPQSCLWLAKFHELGRL